MVKSISVTNKLVLDTLNNAGNSSELIEVAILYYLGEVDETYIETYKTVQRANKTLREGR